MKTNTAIVSAQNSVSAIVPKPTKTDLIDALVQEAIAKREQENLVRQAKRERLKIKFDQALESWKKTKITVGDLPATWVNVGANLYIGSSIPTSPTMQKLHREMREIQNLQTNPQLVKEEVVAGMKKEMMDSIMSQPGVKEVLRSTIVKLGL